MTTGDKTQENNQPAVEDASFLLIMHTDHNLKKTFIRRYEYGKQLDEVIYDKKAHYNLLVSIIEMFRGKGCCDEAPNKPDPKDTFAYMAWIREELKNPNYRNRPLHDVYSTPLPYP